MIIPMPGLEARAQLPLHKTILADHGVIANNVARKEDPVDGQSPGEPIVLFQGQDEQAEAASSSGGGAALGRGRPLSSYSILYRTHALSRTFERNSSGRDLRIVAGLRFYERKEIKDVLAYLRVWPIRMMLSA